MIEVGKTYSQKNVSTTWRINKILDETDEYMVLYIQPQIGGFPVLQFTGEYTVKKSDIEYWEEV